MSPESVHEVGQGRVWIGIDALKIGLVDNIGGMDMAIERAAELAGLEEGTYSLRFLPRPRSVFERMDALLPSVFAEPLGRLMAKRAGTLPAQFGSMLTGIEQANGAVQLRMPLDIRIR
jgi:protease-4